MKRKKILAFVFNDNGRDIEMLLPLCYFAEHILLCKVELAFIYDYHAIYREKPDLVLLPNTVGSWEYFFVSKFANEQHIPVFALDSEGNFRTDGSFDHWGGGYNKDQYYYQRYVCCWSDRTRDYLQKVAPGFKDKIVTTGGTGFDRYVIFDFESKDKYLQKKKKTGFKYVITYAAWAFGKMDYPKGRESLIAYFKGDKDKLALVEPQRKAIEDLLRSIIENNPDILFILKRHPLERRQTEKAGCKNEINNLSHFANVIIEGEEAKIDDLINISDLWLSFESTTAMECWVGGKTTVLLRTDINFSKSIEDKGLDKSQLAVATPVELQAIIEDLKNEGSVKLFHEHKMVREREAVIKNSFGYADGMNHLRAGYFLHKTLESADFSKIKYKLRLKSLVIFILIKLGILFYNPWVFSRLPKAKKFLWVFEQYDLKNAKALYERYSVQLAAFYKEHRIQEKFKSGNLKEFLFEKEHV